MAFVNPVDKFRLSSSPQLPPSSTHSTRSAALDPSWSPRARDYNKAATTKPIPATLQSQRPPIRRRHIFKSVSPDKRRVTRSQSRELENNRHNVDAESTVAAGRGKGKARASRELATVIEAPSSSFAGQYQARREEVIPESPDDHNISGTTILPTDSEPETGDLDPIMMIESLPDLQRASAAVLDFFGPSSSSPASIIEMAKRLQDPKSGQSRRLERLRSNFATETMYFGRETYIAVDRVAHILPSVEIPSGSGSSRQKSWHADGILFKANCARLAFEVLTRSSFTESVEEAIYHLEGKFPSPFLNTLVKENDIDTAGKSSLRRATLDLALEIRTQFFKLTLEKHRNDEDVHPMDLLNHVFYNEILDTQVESGERQLRGFNLSLFQDEDGNLPSRYEEDVSDRIDDIRKFFRDDAGDPIDFDGLEASFSWDGFIYSVAKWIRKRDDELNRHLSQQPAVDDIRDEIRHEVNRRSSFNQLPQAVQEKAELEFSTAAAEGSSQQPRRSLMPAAEIKEKRKAKSRSSEFMYRKSQLLDQFHRFEDKFGPGRKTNEQGSRQHAGFAEFISIHASKEPGASAPSRASALPEELLRIEPREREIPASPEGNAIPFSGNVVSFSTDPDQTIVADPQWEDADIPYAQRSERMNRDRARVSQVVQAPDIEEGSVKPISSEGILAAIKQYKQTRGSRPGPARHAFIDRQTTASRVSPIFENSQAPSRSRLGKRKRVETRDEESDDEFIQDQRQVDIQNKRAQKPLVHPKRLRLFDPDEDEDEDEDEPGRQLHNNLASSSMPSASQQSYIDRVTSSAPITRARWTGPSPDVSRVPQPQVRKRFTLDEDRRLISLIEKLGPSWAAIKREDDLWPVEDGGPKLEHRYQVQLKDRARNLAFNLLKSGQPLPRNFEQVTMKKADKDKLRSMGVQLPERSEFVMQR